MGQRIEATVALKLISAKAQQLEQDVEKHRLWPGQLEEGLQDIERQIQRVRAQRLPDC